MAEEETYVEPKTSEISIKAELGGTFDGISKRLAGLQMLEIEETADSLKLASVESRDMQKRPFVFFVLELRKDALVLSYTIAADSSPNLRRLKVLKNALGILSLVTDLYRVDNSEFFQYIDSAIDELMGSLSQSYSALFNSYDAMFNEYRELKRSNIEIEAANKSMSVDATRLTEENKRMSARIKELEAYSDASLMTMVEEWLETHDSEIDIEEFSKTYRLTQTRVEEILNRMVSTGYLEVKG